MQQRLPLVLAIILIVHLAVSLFFIVDPLLLRGTRLSKIYKSYLLPGPFFSDVKIIDNYRLHVSWRVNGQWSVPKDYAMENFKSYQSQLNLSSLYRSRLERTLYLKLLLPHEGQEPELFNRKEFIPFIEYHYEHYLPKTADSIRLTFVHKKVTDFTIKTDSANYLLAR